MRRVAVAAMLPALAVLVIGSSGCVSAAKYRELEGQNRNMQTRLDEAEMELAGERAKAKELAAKLAAEMERNQALKNQVDMLAAARDRLQQAYDILKAEFDKLQGQPPRTITITKTQPLPPALNQALIDLASKYPGQVEYDAERGLLKWKSDLLFDLGSAQLKQDALPALQDFASILKSEAAAGFDILIAGHTDNTRIAREATRREHPTNWHLSAHRAISVLFEMIKDGVEPTRQTVMGYGEYQPIAPNDTTANKSLNRRVEIYLVKKGNVPGSAPAPEMGQPAGQPAETEPVETAN